MRFDPGEITDEKCEFCGYSIGLVWYDACCSKQYQKYREVDAPAWRALKEDVQSLLHDIGCEEIGFIKK